MRARGIGFIGAAALLHLTIPAVARIAPRWEPPVLARSSGVLHVEAIDVEVAPPSLPEPEAIAPSTREPSPRDPQRAPPRDSDPRSPSSPPDTAAPPEVAPSATPTAAPSASPDGFDRPPDIAGGPIAGVPGLGGPPVWARPGMLAPLPSSAPAPTTTPADRPVDRQMAGKLLDASMKARDSKLGLDLPGAGTIAAKIVEAVWASDTPATARGTFQARLSPTGQVVSVRPLSWSAGSPDLWQHAASIATGKLAGITIPMPGSYPAGAIVTVQVVSAVSLPAGSGSRGISTFDLSDIGTKPHRVVTSSLSITAIP